MPEIQQFAENFENHMNQTGQALEAELKELEGDLMKVDWEGANTQLFTEMEIMPSKKMDLITCIAYSTAFVFMVAAFVAAALYTPKKESKVEQMTAVVVDGPAQPNKKQLKKTLKSIMKNNNTKTSLIQ